MNLTWKWFARSLMMRKPQVSAFVGLTFIVFVCGLVFPIFTQKAVDAIISQGSLQLFGLFLLLAMVALAVEALLTHVRQLNLIKLGTFVDNRLSNLCFLHMMRLRADRKVASSGSISVYFQYLSKLRGFILVVLPRTAIDAGGAVAALIIMTMYSLPVTACAVTILIISALDMKRLMPQIHSASAEHFKADGKRLEFFNESYNSLETIKTLTTEGRRYRHWRALTRDFLEKVAAVHIVSHNIGLSALAWSRISSLTIAAVGCYQISQGALSVGDLIALQLFSFRLQIPIVSLGDIVRQYEEATIALAAIRAFLLSDREKANATATAAEPGTRLSLAFANVSLTYQGNDRPAISNVSFAMPEKGLVAIVGRNGAGKTTLLNILLGLQRDYTGCVTLAGTDIRNLNPRTLRSRISVAAQDAVLFAGSLRSNLDVGLAPRDENDMTSALSRAEGISILDATGFEREIKEFGRNLSGGQRQRIAVARSLIGDPPILVLDEPTAFLDSDAANRLDKALIELANDRLLVMVSHNLTATRAATMIIVLRSGVVAGIGAHDALLAGCTEYKSLWESHLEHR